MSDGTIINAVLVFILIGVVIYLIEHPDTTGARKAKFDTQTATITNEGKVLWAKAEAWVKSKSKSS